MEKEEYLKYLKKWRENNRDRIREYQREWRENNKERKKAFDRKYANTTRKQKRKVRRQLEPKFRLDSNMGSIVSICLRGKKAGRKWESLVGYTINGLIQHLEKQFDKNMSWENYGSYWSIDHIKPKSSFKYTHPEDEEFKECWTLINLQPMEKITNIKKSNKLLK